MPRKRKKIGSRKVEKRLFIICEGKKDKSESILEITWKQQHINNACVPACMAMLLSQYNILKEDRDIIYESKRPYLLNYDINNSIFVAGILIQTENVMNIVPNENDLLFINCQVPNCKSYNSLYFSQLLRSSELVPIPTILPSSKTTILSEDKIVDNL